MFKLVSAALVATTLLFTSINHHNAVLAGTCASKCGRRPIQFTPGQRIRIEVVNATSNLVKLERVQGGTPISLQPGQKLQLEPGGNTQPNLSLIFWSETELPLEAIVTKPNFGTLHLEIRPGWRYPGDRSLYILNDGSINVF
ncbi:MAG: hypothetical protein KME21_02210 [Desmonostoc vinosum HA7617-LM4]|jgi:hypothetical protein|nr:hypothetical protein [Desmonostoc vinosum HA7617-LM4]